MKLRARVGWRPSWREVGLLEVSGCIGTIDAMGCQKEITRKIVERKTDYVLALKEDQKQLYEEVVDTFENAHARGFAGLEHEVHQTVGKGHGRIETRQCRALSDPEVWPT